MQDARTRELERRWRETRDPADAQRLLQELRRTVTAPAELLRARFAAGLLGEERLELACYLGLPLVLELVGAEDEAGALDLESWVLGLGRWGKPLCVRAATAATRGLLPLWEARQPGEARPARAVAAAEAWLVQPGERNAARALDAAQAVWLLGDAQNRRNDPAAARAWEAAWPEPADGERAEAIAGATGSAAYAARADEDLAPQWAVNAAGLAAVALRDAGGEGAVRAAIRDELGAWALE